MLIIVGRVIIVTQKKPPGGGSVVDGEMTATILSQFQYSTVRATLRRSKLAVLAY